MSRGGHRKGSGRKRAPFEKFSGKKKAAYLQALREGNHKCTSARSCGVSPQLVCLYRKAFPAFASEEEDAQMEAYGNVENAMYQAAISGNVTAGIFILQNRLPDRWKDMRRVEQHTRVSGDMPATNINVQMNVLELLKERDYLEYLRSRAIAADSNTGVIRAGSQPGPVENGSPPGLPGPGGNGDDNGHPAPPDNR